MTNDGTNVYVGLGNTAVILTFGGFQVQID